MRVYSSILLTLLAFTFHAQAEEAPPTTKLSLVSHLYTQVVDAPAKKSRVAGTIVELSFERQISTDVKTLLNGGTRLEGGSSRALYDDEFAPRQTPILREASVTWSPQKACGLSGGALNQNLLDSPLVTKDQSFPGVHEFCELPVGQFRIGAEAEQTYAADTQFTHPTGRSLQSDAQFFIEKLKLGYHPSDSLTLDLHISHYLFSGLSSLVAYESQFMGNTSSGLDDRNADFAYSYTPFEMGLNAKVAFAPFDMMLKSELIKNPGAPSGKNEAWQASLGPGWNASTNRRWDLVATYFDIESDATPAFFNDPSTAHANSRGLGAQVKLTMPESKMEASISYTLSHPISTTLYQPGDQNWAFAVLRLHYDIL